MRGHRDLSLVSAGAVACALVALLFPLEAVRVLAAVPLCLILPGYAIAAAVFGAREIDFWRGFVLTLGMSLSVLALGGFVLNYGPGGVRGSSWAILLVLVVVGSCRSAALRRGAPGRSASPVRPRLALGAGQAALLAAALVVATAALVIAETPFPADEARGFSRLWMLPTPNRGEVRIGAGSEEHDSFDYTLEFRVGGQQKAQKIDFRLDPGEVQEFTLPLGRAAERGPVRAKASLIRKDRFQDVYRRVTMWLPAHGAPAP